MADHYWIGLGANTNWNTVGNWSATDGGASNGTVPGTGDAVFFTALSPSPSVLSASQSIGSLDCTGFTGTLTHNASVTLTVDGAGGVFKLAAGMTYTMAANTATSRVINFTGAGTFLLTTAGKLIPSITVNGASTVVQQQDALTMVSTFAGQLILTSGTYDANDFAFTGTTVTISGATARTFDRGAGTWTILGSANGTYLDATTTTNLTHLGTGAIVLAPASAFNANFIGGALTYNALTLTGNGGLLFMNGLNTFASFAINGGHILQLGAAQTITAAPSWVGTRAAPIIIMSNLPQTSRTLTFSSGTADCDYLILQGVIVAAGTHYAGYHSVNMNSVTGWTFTPKPNHALSGTVKDKDGAALSGATVYCEKLTSGVWEQATAAETSDGDGLVSFNVRDADGTYRLTARKTGSPNVFDLTDFDQDPDTDGAELYLRSQADKTASGAGGGIPQGLHSIELGIAA